LSGSSESVAKLLRQVQPEENVVLEAPFREDEVRHANSSSYAEGAPRPDGLTFLFYQKF
jgi:hypothetical protein